MIVTPKGLLLSAREFEALPDYSCSVPTGTTLGKRWRRRQPYQVRPGVEYTFFMGEYTWSSKPDRVNIEWSKIVLPDGYVPEELRGLNPSGPSNREIILAKPGHVQMILKAYLAKYAPQKPLPEDLEKYAGRALTWWTEILSNAMMSEEEFALETVNRLMGDPLWKEIFSKDPLLLQEQN